MDPLQLIEADPGVRQARDALAVRLATADGSDIAGLAREGGPNGEPPHLLRETLGVATGSRPEGRATANADRRAVATGTRCACGLLAVDLAGAALNFAAGLCHGVAAALVGALGDERLVEDSHVRLDAEDGLIHIHFAQLPPDLIHNGELHRRAWFQHWRPRAQ